MAYTHQHFTGEDHETEYRISVTTEWEKGTAYLSNGAKVSNSLNANGNIEAFLEVKNDLDGKAETVHSFSLVKTQVQAQTNPGIEAIVMENGVELGRSIHAFDSLFGIKNRSVNPKGQGTTTGAKKIKRPWPKIDKTENQKPKKKKRTFRKFNEDQSKD